MDPASASVAFIGFAASLASITALVVDSSKALYKVCKSLKDAPSDIRRLQKKIKRLEEIVLKIKTAASDFCDASVQVSLEEYWSSHVAELEDDLDLFKAKIIALHTALEKKSISKMHSIARIRKFFSEDEIDKYEQIISSHMESFSFMLSILLNAQARSLLEKLSAQSGKIDDLVASTNLLCGSIQRGIGESQSLLHANADEISSVIVQNFERITDQAYRNEEILALSPLRRVRVTKDSLRTDHIDRPTFSQNITTRDITPKFPRPAIRSPEEADIITKSTARCLPNLHTPKPGHYLLSTKLLSKISVHWLPIGVVSIQRRRGHATYTRSHKTSKQSRFSIDIVLFAASWIAKRMLHISVELGTSIDGTSSIHWDFRQAIYNDDPALLEYVRKGDLCGLQRLFLEGRARATDLLAPWSNSLLHEAVFGFASGIPQSYQICEFLLNEGADPNFRSIGGRTPLLLCSRLMNETKCNELQEIATLLVCRGADLALCGPDGRSVCSEIFQSPRGLQYLESFLYRHVDLFTLQQMASTDAWILGGLARSFPTFQTCLQSYLREYRTPSTISSYLAPQTDYLKELDIRQQVTQVKQANAHIRTGFLKALCAKGTLAMVKPFLESGIDLNELDDRSSLSYVRAAAKAGNIEVLDALLHAGASMNSNISYSLTAVLSPVDELLERWYSLRIGRPEYYGKAESEYWILQELLRNPTFRGPNVLLLALQTRQPPFIFKQLLDAGCGRRDGNPPASWELKRLGSEVIVSVTENNPILPRFLEYGLALECEDRFGFTALLHALDRGLRSLDFTKILIDADADVLRRTGSGYTPLELAAQNLAADHPRSSTRWTQSLRCWQSCTVTEEEDREAYEQIKKAIRKRRVAVVKAWLRSERPSSLLLVV